MNSQSQCQLDAFCDLLDRHGCDLSTWPESSRDDMQRLLEQSAVARAALDDAQRLDQLLASDSVPAPSASLRRQLLQGHANASNGWRFRWAMIWRELGGVRFAAPALTAALAMGIAVGSWVLPVDQTVTDNNSDLLSLVQYNLDDTELESP